MDTIRTYFPFYTEDHRYLGHTFCYSRTDHAPRPAYGHADDHGYAYHATTGTLSGAGHAPGVDAGTGKISS
ncbi:hypothetical protein [Sphaerisporangium aureirubrum]|uniref:Uncharacterized protein n=1 Tax=Sphaerisporangium aureirubrum TaxID=1544736 RepID=A0ABW1NSJ1_9ACTN